MVETVAVENEGSFAAWQAIAAGADGSERARDERDLAMLEMRDCGYSAPQIGALFGFSAPYVRTIWRRCGEGAVREVQSKLRAVS